MSRSWIAALSAVAVFAVGCKQPSTPVAALADADGAGREAALQADPRLAPPVPCLYYLCANGFMSYQTAEAKGFCDRSYAMVRAAATRILSPSPGGQGYDVQMDVATLGGEKLGTDREPLYLDDKFLSNDDTATAPVPRDLTARGCGVVTLGHSHGGEVALRFVASLPDQVPVPFVGLVDPIDRDVKPSTYLGHPAGSPERREILFGSGAAPGAINQRAPVTLPELSLTAQRVDASNGFMINWYQDVYKFLNSGPIRDVARNARDVKVPPQWLIGPGSEHETIKVAILDRVQPAADSLAGAIDLALKKYRQGATCGDLRRRGMQLYAKIPAGQPKTPQLVEIVARYRAGCPPLTASTDPTIAVDPLFPGDEPSLVAGEPVPASGDAALIEETIPTR